MDNIMAFYRRHATVGVTRHLPCKRKSMVFQRCWVASLSWSLVRLKHFGLKAKKKKCYERTYPASVRTNEHKECPGGTDSLQLYLSSGVIILAAVLQPAVCL